MHRPTRTSTTCTKRAQSTGPANTNPVPLVHWCVDDVAETDGEDVAGARTTLPGLWRTASWAESPRYHPSYGSICTSSPSTTAVPPAHFDTRGLLHRERSPPGADPGAPLPVPDGLVPDERR